LSEPFSRGQAWVDLLLLTSHSDHFIFVRGNKIDIKRGQICVSQETLSERWKWSRNKVVRFINSLEKLGQVKQQKSHIKSLITIVNFEIYQGSETTDETTDETTGETTERQQKDNKRNTIKNVNNLNNLNNVKNVDNLNPPTPLKGGDDFVLPAEIDSEIWGGFVEMRKKIKKPLTERAKNLILKELIKINSRTNQCPNDILNQSVMNCWQGVFEIKQINTKGNNYATSTPKNAQSNALQACAELLTEFENNEKSSYSENY
jgi:hypothetical protein